MQNTTLQRPGGKILLSQQNLMEAEDQLVSYQILANNQMEGLKEVDMIP